MLMPLLKNSLLALVDLKRIREMIETAIKAKQALIVEPFSETACQNPFDHRHLLSRLKVGWNHYILAERNSTFPRSNLTFHTYF
jgi:hypothetical protein